MKNIKTLYSVIIFLSLLLGFYSIYLFGVGNHNVDLGKNVSFLNAKYGLNLLDANSIGEIWTGDEMYITGQSQVKQAFFFFGLSIFLLGFSLKEIIN